MDDLRYGVIGTGMMGVDEGFHHGSSYLEHLDFLAAVRDDLPPKVSLEDGLAAVAVGVAAHRSIDELRPVTLAEVL